MQREILYSLVVVGVISQIVGTFGYVQYPCLQTTSCGGVGQFLGIRLDSQVGIPEYPCPIQLGRQIRMIMDFTVSTDASSLSLKVSALYLGFPITIIDAVLEDPVGIKAGVTYSLPLVSVTPNDGLSGSPLKINFSVYNADTKLMEICEVMDIVA